MLNILVLTNRLEERAFLRSRLSRQGYRVIDFDRQLESLESCLRITEHIDAAFLPSRDIALIRALRAHPSTAKATVICFVSQTSKLELDDPEAKDCDLIIKRPNGQEELLEALVEALHSRGTFS